MAALSRTAACHFFVRTGGIDFPERRCGGKNKYEYLSLYLKCLEKGIYA